MQFLISFQINSITAEVIFINQLRNYVQTLAYLFTAGGVVPTSLVLGILKGPMALGRLFANVENSAGVVTPNFI